MKIWHFARKLINFTNIKYLKINPLCSDYECIFSVTSFHFGVLFSATRGVPITSHSPLLPRYKTLTFSCDAFMALELSPLISSSRKLL